MLCIMSWGWFQLLLLQCFPQFKTSVLQCILSFEKLRSFCHCIPTRINVTLCWNVLHLPDKGLHLEQQLYSVMEDICKLVDAIPLHELTSISCAKELLQQRELRYGLISIIIFLLPCSAWSSIRPVGVSITLWRWCGATCGSVLHC